MSDLDSLSALSWLLDAGADEAVLDEPVNRLVARAPAAPVSPTTALREPVRGPAPTSFEKTFARPMPQAEKKSAPAIESDSVGSAMDIVARCNSLAELKTAMEAFD